MKQKCIVCKFANVVAEAERHPNDTTTNLAINFNNRILQRQTKDIKSFCEEHRNTLKLNVVLTGYHEKLKKVIKLFGMSTEYQQVYKILESEGKL